MEDDDLERAFGALRAHDRAIAPPFAPMKIEAERRARARKARRAAIVSLAAAAIVLLAVWLSWPEPKIERAIVRPNDSLAFLMEPPSASVVSAEAPIDQIGEAW